ncbi:YkgJ family cysteine cluster protein [Candidatus Bathyarchaeota archaeon]|nr:YkgJ family cysteine cluster protein [Candidatus Bathyarchaeota archaeon]
MYNPPVLFYSESKITINIDGEKKIIEFMYPLGLKWSCKRCGLCCQNVDDYIRHILLTDSDLERFKTGSYNICEISELSNEEAPFKNEMKKKLGKCVMLTESGCKSYEFRPLLCRMYPFWIERKNDVFIIRLDNDCKGFGTGDNLTEEFYKKLIAFAIKERGGL